MKKFRYSLENVMDYKAQVLDGIQGELSVCMERVQKQQSFVESLYEKRRELEQEFGKLKHKGGAIQRFQMFQEVIDRRGEEIKLEESRLRKLVELSEEKKAELILAKQDVSKFEKLKEHKLLDYQKEVQRADERFIEEFVANLKRA